MDVPRLLAFALSLRVGLSLWGRHGLGWHFEGAVRGLIIGGVAVLLLVLNNVHGDEPFDVSPGVLIVLSVNSLVVALLEETLFRGVLFNALYEYEGLAAALGVSALLFTVYHVQAQPLSQWPVIFLFGLLFATLRWQGVGFPWLILSHAVGDSVIYLGSTGHEQSPLWPLTVLLLQTIVVLPYALWATRHVRDP